MKERDAEKIAELCHAMSNARRVEILFLCLKKPRSVMELTEKLAISQSLVSHNLRHLRETQLLRAERSGKQILYDIDDDHVRCILNDLLKHAKHMN